MNIKDPKYDYEKIYKKGTSNTNADALSRVNGILAQKDGQSQLVINDELKRLILYEYHDAPLGWGTEM
jgi:hypothetical protein